MVIVDTTVWIDYLHGTENLHTKWLERELQQQRLGLTELILCEVLQGIRSETIFSQVREELLRFHVYETGTSDLAVAAAKNYRMLRSRGCTVRKTIDCLIATFCIEGGHTLLHRDRDFDPFQKVLGMQIVDV